MFLPHSSSLLINRFATNMMITGEDQEWWVFYHLRDYIFPILYLLIVARILINYKLY